VSPPSEDSSRRLSAWRILAGVIVLAGLVLAGIVLFPVYFQNMGLQKYLHRQVPLNQSDHATKREILDEGHSLGLDMVPDQIELRHVSADGQMKLRYAVRVSLPLYTVHLHFSSNMTAQPGSDRRQSHRTKTEFSTQ